MALYLVTGVMGGGKSYLGAEVCLRAFEEGAMVHTNMRLNEETIKSRGWSDKYIKLPDDPGAWQSVIHAGEEGSENLLMVDEAALAFHVRDQQKKSNDNRDIFELLIWSRKAGLDVYFISQSAANLDVQLRRLTEIRWHCVAVKMIPFVGWFAAPLLGQFKRLRYGGGEGKNLIGSTYHRFSQKVGDFYSTDDTVGRSLGLKKTVGRAQKKNKDKRLALTVVAFLVAAVAFGVWRVKLLYADLKSKGTPADVDSVAVSPGVVASPAGSPVVAPGFKAYSVQGIQWIVAEKDDLVIAAVDGSLQAVYCRGGAVLALTRHYDGEEISAILEYGGRYYATTTTGRKLIARQPTREERTLWRQSGAKFSQAYSGPLPSAPSWVPELNIFSERSARSTATK